MAENERQPNELKLGAVLSYTEIAVQFVVAMLYTPVMLRLLGQVEYGLYSLVASVVSYLSLLSFGFAGGLHALLRPLPGGRKQSSRRPQLVGGKLGS